MEMFLFSFPYLINLFGWETNHKEVTFIHIFITEYNIKGHNNYRKDVQIYKLILNRSQ